MREIFMNIIIFSAIALTLQCCTISFQNISTHGTATDLVDQEQAAKADVKADVTVPVKAI